MNPAIVFPKRYSHGNCQNFECQLYQFYYRSPRLRRGHYADFFWLDEDNRNTFHLFQLVRNPGKCNASDDKSVRYNDSDEWPAHAPVAMWIDYGLVNEFLREWCLRKEQLKAEKFQRTNILNGKSTGLLPEVALMKREMTRKITVISGEINNG